MYKLPKPPKQLRDRTSDEFARHCGIGFVSTNHRFIRQTCIAQEDCCPVVDGKLEMQLEWVSWRHVGSINLQPSNSTSRLVHHAVSEKLTVGVGDGTTKTRVRQPIGLKLGADLTVWKFTTAGCGILPSMH